MGNNFSIFKEIIYGQRILRNEFLKGEVATTHR